MSYRYQVGDRVLCRTGENEWDLGTIVKLNYRDPGWPKSRTVPYQVRIVTGQLIFVPMDVEQLCRMYVPPWWEPLLQQLPAREPPPGELRAACAGSDVNQGDHMGNVAISLAVQLGWLNGVKELISMNADVDFANSKEVCPLHLAAQQGASTAPGLTALLLGAKADPNCQDRDPDFDPDFTSTTFGDKPEHRTPLHYCSLEGDEMTIKLLLKGNAEVDVEDAQRKTPLHLAIEEDKVGAFDLLVNHGADVNRCTLESGMKNTPLMDAVHTGNHAWAERLLLAKADVNKQGKQNMSALHLAARRGDAKAAQALLSARADAAQRSTCGTAVELARKNGGAELLGLLGAELLMEEDPCAKSGNKVVSVASLNAYQRAALFMD